MKMTERGFTLIETIISVTIMVLAGGAAGAAIFQILSNTQRNTDHMNAVSQVQNAGHWISCDVQMAQSITTANLTPPDFLVANWTEWDALGNPTYHTVKYFFEDMNDGIATLKRNHRSTAGADEYTLIAQFIYYNPSDDTGSSEANYQSPVLKVKLTAHVEQITESKEYKIQHRPNY